MASTKKSATTAKKPATKGSAAKAPAAKAKAAPAKATKPAAKKAAPITEKYTKTQIVNSLVESTELSRKQVNAVLDGLADIIGRHLGKKGVGEFTLPGLMKIKTVKKPARKARKGINPFTGEETVFKAKPASTSVKILALKKLKDMAN
ncbi:MAG TPA: HU family DNA-binding protein [Porticoccaceae bacterium]